MSVGSIDGQVSASEPPPAKIVPIPSVQFSRTANPAAYAPDAVKHPAPPSGTAVQIDPRLMTFPFSGARLLAAACWGL